MLEINKNKQAQEILKAIALCGEYPAQSIMLIRHNNDEYLRRTFRYLQRDGFISKIGQKQSKRFVLLQRGIETLSGINPLAVEQYNALMKNHHGDKAHALRELRVAEVKQLMALADVHTMLSDKPELQNISATTNHPPAVEKVTTEVFENLPSYYFDSKEIKRCDIVGLYKTSFTRACGLYVTPANWYAIFNLRTGLTEWSTSSEYKQCEMMKTIIKRNSFGYPRSLETEKASNIIIAREPVIANKIIDDTEAEIRNRHSKFKGSEKVKRRHFVQLDNTYESTHFILCDKTGTEMLRILAVPGFKERLKNASLPKECQLDEYSATGADGVDENRNFYLLFFDSDLVKLRKFRDGTNLNHVQPNKCLVACFPWQESIIKQCLSPETRTLVYTMAEIESVLGIKQISKGI